MFKKALLNATYKDGLPGTRTKEHEEAEFHKFKTDHLFKNKKISKDLYVARLIQQYKIIQILEIKLNNLMADEKSEISAFLTLNYLSSLWRTSFMQSDLTILGVNPKSIADSQIVEHTRLYLEQINTLSPKLLLAHFLLHVSGFMHGGNIILSKYIKPSNELSAYNIPFGQYDFSAAMSAVEVNSPIAIFNRLMKDIEGISLSEAEQEEIINECKEVYVKMKEIYDDLLAMHIQKSSGVAQNTLIFYVSLVVITAIFSLLISSSLSNTDSPLPLSRMTC